MKKRGTVAFILFFIVVIPLISAKEMCVTAEVSSINPSSVDSDEDFTVGILIDNCGDDIPDNIAFEIYRYSSDIRIKEPLKTEIGKLGYANSQRFLTYHMHSSPEANPGIHYLQTRLTYGFPGFLTIKESNFSVTINSKRPDLAISKVMTEPEVVYKKEAFILTIDVENEGNGDAKDVRASLENFNLAGATNKYLGEIAAGETIPARFVLQADKEGTYRGYARIQFKESGITKDKVFPVEVQVFKKDYSTYWIIFGIILALIIAYIIWNKFISRK